MIVSLNGILEYKSTNYVVINIHGIGYGVSIPLTTYKRLPGNGQQVSLYIYTHFSQENMKLYGFIDFKDRTIFELMISMNGIGPKLAVTVLSSISADDFSQAVFRKDMVKLTSIPGIGKKMAERMILELKDKIEKIGIIQQAVSVDIPDHEAPYEDALSALLNLGYAPKSATYALEQAKLEYDKGGTLENILNAALKFLSGRNL